MCLAAGCGGLFLGLASIYAPGLQAFDHLTAHFAGLTVVAIAALIIRRARLLVLAAGCLSIVLAPALYAQITRCETCGVAVAKSGRASVRILSFNMLFLNDDHAAIEAAIREAQADIVLLTEYHEGKLPILERLRAIYPHQITCAANAMDKFNATCDIAILSTKPWVHAEAGQDKGVRMALATFDHGGKPFTVIATHLTLPFRGFQQAWGLSVPVLAPTRQAADFSALANVVAHVPRGPVIAGGDFNASPWSSQVRRFKADTGLRRAGGWFPTWPATFGLPQLAIDQFFVSDSVRVKRVWLGDSAGSDHYAILGEFEL